MALRSVDQPEKIAATDSRYVEGIVVIAGDDFCIDLGIPTDQVDGAEMRRLADRLTEMASANLQLAIVRGDDDSDMPRTLEDALLGIGVLLRLSIGLKEGAAKLEGRGS